MMLSSNFQPKSSFVNLKFINDALAVLQYYHWKYSVTYADIFRGYYFEQEVWEQRPPETQKDIIVIFEERLQTSTETYSEHSQISKMELYVKMVNRLKPFFNYVLMKLCWVVKLRLKYTYGGNKKQQLKIH